MACMARRFVREQQKQNSIKSTTAQQHNSTTAQQPIAMAYQVLEKQGINS